MPLETKSKTQGNQQAKENPSKSQHQTKQCARSPKKSGVYVCVCYLPQVIQVNTDHTAHMQRVSRMVGGAAAGR